GINGLAYNPADNSIIATQQWGGANSDGYINKFTANGLNPIASNDVYDFIGVNPSSSCTNDANQMDYYITHLDDEALPTPSGWYILGVLDSNSQDQNGVCRGAILGVNKKPYVNLQYWKRDSSCYWQIGNWSNTSNCAS
ncbi:MAG: hypothetical protein RL017_518, partial [Pseudomonadota bacterium]